MIATVLGAILATAFWLRRLPARSALSRHSTRLLLIAALAAALASMCRMLSEQCRQFYLDALHPQRGDRCRGDRAGIRRRRCQWPAVRDAPPDDLVDPRHDVGIRIDVAAGEPPHLNEGARDDTRDAKRVRHLTAHPARHRTGDPAEQLAERAMVVVGDPTEQRPQAVCTTAQAGSRGTVTTKTPRDGHVVV